MKIAVALAVLIVVAFLATTNYVRRHPLEAFVRMTRRGLVRAGMARRTVEVDGNRVVYFAGGSGARTIVLIHGVNDQSGSWVSVVPDLMKDSRVIALDLPGHGESAPATGPLPMPLLLKTVETVIDRESAGKPVVLVGNSMGGWVSMLYAAGHSDRLSHLVLEDASGMSWDVSHVPIAPKNRDEALTLLRMVWGPDMPIADYLVDAMLKGAATMPQTRVLQGGIVFALVDTRLSAITAPVTMIWGAHDGLLPLAYADALHERLPGSTLHVIDNAAHIPHRQAPKEFIRILREALP